MDRQSQVGDRLLLMETFVRIVEAGSLSAAATQLRATQPTVSRRLQALEQSLGVRLLQRSTHAMRLTEDGERYFDGAKRLLANWASLEADARGVREEPQGLLRVAVPHAFGQEKFVGALADFLRQHPLVTVEWILRDDVRDTIAAGIDCIIQVGEPADPALVAVKISEVPRIVVASPELLAGRALPREPAALADLTWLALSHYYVNSVTLTHADTRQSETIAIRPRLSTNNLYALRNAALQGLGACVGSHWLLADDIARGALVHLAPDWTAAPLPVYLTYPHARFYPSRLLNFVAIMRERVPALIGANARA